MRYAGPVVGVLALTIVVFVFLMNRPPPGLTFFPYTTLFRSRGEPEDHHLRSLDAHRAFRLRVRTPPRTEARHRRPHDRKSTRLNSSHVSRSYAVFCVKTQKE